MIVYCKKKTDKIMFIRVKSNKTLQFDYKKKIKIKLYNCIAISLKKQCWLLKELEKEKYNKK
jgi:hypothetical protein